MWAEVFRLRQDGRVLHRGWWGSQTLFRGRLEFQPRWDPLHDRHAPQAWMAYSKHEDINALGVLYEARLDWIKGDTLCLSGLEREPTMQREMAQSWLVRPISSDEACAPKASGAPGASPREG